MCQTVQTEDNFTLMKDRLPLHVWHQYFNPSTPMSAKFKTEENILNFILQNCQEQTAPHGSTAQ